MPALARGLRRLAPLLACLALAAAAWLLLDGWADRWAGRPGLAVTTRDANGPHLEVRLAPVLSSPDALPAPPLRGSRDASATLLAHRDGPHTFYFGATYPATLLVDGRAVAATRDDRAHEVAVELTAGPHALEVVTSRADPEGGLVLAMRPPGTPWRNRLLGAGDLSSESLAEVNRRLGAHAPLLCRLQPHAATATVLALFIAALALRRRAALAWLRATFDDDDARAAAALLCVIALLLPLLEPLWQPGYYACHEEESFIVRFHQFEAAIRAGVPMGRWWPDPVLGRGYPFLCYYAPLLYLIIWPLLALSASAELCIKLLSALLLVGAAGATWLLVRRRASRGAALVAVAMTLYAPYFQFDLYVRAALAETLGFALVPLSLWALDRALDRDLPSGARVERTATLAIALGLLGLSHNITSYFALWWIGLWIAVRAGARDVDRGGLLRVAAGGALGFAISACHTIPTTVERTLVWVERIKSGYYSYWKHYQKPFRLLLDPRDVTIGWWATLIVLLAVAAWIRALRRRERRPETRLTLHAVAGLALSILLLTRAGAVVYRYVPLADFVQFPWRLYVFAAGCAALCAAGAVDGWIPSGWPRRLAAPALAALIAMVAWPNVGPQGPLLKKHTHEEFLLRLGVDYVTSMNEYLPRVVRRTVPPFGPVAHTLPPGPVGDAEKRPGRYRAHVVALQPTTLEWNCHLFPGWHAFVDGAEVPILPPDDGGLLRVALPPGDHQAEVRYLRTPLRFACDALSLGAALCALGLILVGRGRLRRRPAR